MRLQGKNAIVTGARTGIGRAITELFAKEGANVWAIVHREDEAWLNDMNALSSECAVWIKPVYIDLSEEEQIKQGMQGIIKDKLPIDILVNAAGVLTPNRLFTMTSIADMRKLMDVNFFATMQMSQLAARVMMRQKCGSIIHISSISAWANDIAQLEYAASKAAINCATKKMATELGAYGVRVNAVAPGLIDTKMLAEADDEKLEQFQKSTYLKHIGKPIDVAYAVLYLACDESSYVTGQVFRIDGGMI